MVLSTSESLASVSLLSFPMFSSNRYAEELQITYLSNCTQVFQVGLKGSFRWGRDRVEGSMSFAEVSDPTANAQP